MNTGVQKKWWLSIVICLVTVGQLAAQPIVSPRVKVHKRLISVSAPNADGLVLVKGAAGAIETTSSVSLYVENLKNKVRIVFDMADDGSFATAIAVEPGQKIRITARNLEGKKSIGTFTVPGVAETPTAPPPAAPPKRTIGETTGNTVIVLLAIDTATGRIVANRQIAGSLGGSAESPADLVNKLLDRCVTIISDAYNRPTATDAPKEN